MGSWRMGLIIEVNSVTDHSFINLSNYTATIKPTINACEQDQDPNLIANNPTLVHWMHVMLDLCQADISDIFTNIRLQVR